jgi:hypothetical protein
LHLKDGLPRFGITRMQNGPVFIASGRKPLARGWVHLAGVVHADRLELYVDGQLAATAQTDGFIPGEGGQGMEIGFDVGNSPAEVVDHFQGVLDEIKVFSSALRAEEIAAASRR